jgi:ethanolamine ammonia-lyase large subunit
LYVRRVLGLAPAPEFEAWLQRMQIFSNEPQFRLNDGLPPTFRDALRRLS